MFAPLGLRGAEHVASGSPPPPLEFKTNKTICVCLERMLLVPAGKWKYRSSSRSTDSTRYVKVSPSVYRLHGWLRAAAKTRRARRLWSRIARPHMNAGSVTCSITARFSFLLCVYLRQNLRTCSIFFESGLHSLLKSSVRSRTFVRSLKSSLHAMHTVRANRMKHIESFRFPHVEGVFSWGTDITRGHGCWSTMMCGCRVVFDTRSYSSGGKEEGFPH